MQSFSLPVSSSKQSNLVQDLLEDHYLLDTRYDSPVPLDPPPSPVARTSSSLTSQSLEEVINERLTRLSRANSNSSHQDEMPADCFRSHVSLPPAPAIFDQKKEKEMPALITASLHKKRKAQAEDPISRRSFSQIMGEGQHLFHTLSQVVKTTGRKQAQTSCEDLNTCLSVGDSTESGRRAFLSLNKQYPEIYTRVQQDFGVFLRHYRLEPDSEAGLNYFTHVLYPAFMAEIIRTFSTAYLSSQYQARAEQYAKSTLQPYSAFHKQAILESFKEEGQVVVVPAIKRKKKKARNSASSSSSSSSSSSQSSTTDLSMPRLFSSASGSFLDFDMPAGRALSAPNISLEPVAIPLLPAGASSSSSSTSSSTAAIVLALDLPFSTPALEPAVPANVIAVGGAQLAAASSSVVSAEHPSQSSFSSTPRLS